MVMYNLGKVTFLGLPEWEALGQDELKVQVDLKHTEGESVYTTLSPPCTATLIAKNRTELQFSFHIYIIFLQIVSIHDFINGSCG